MEPSIFTKIINGEIPCHKVYEDELTFAFMDIQPIQPGMVLVIPKEQIDNYEDLPEETAHAVTTTSQKVMRALRKMYPGKKKIGVQIEGLEVPHAHVKLFPLDTGAEFHAKPFEGEPNHDELAKIAAKLRKELSGE